MKIARCCCALSAGTTLVFGYASEVCEEPSGYELWGARSRHPAVVNEVCPAGDGSVLSLNGDWDFVHHPKYNLERNVYWCKFAEVENWGAVKKVKVPGALSTQGFGEPGILKAEDGTWDFSPKPMRHIFSGSGWYRRTFRIPAGWTGKRIWLRIGDVRSQGWFWVNGAQVAWHEAYCGTYKYEISDLVKPGEDATFVIQVSNEVATRGGSRNGHNRWCGILRSLELEATPQTLIDDAWARGDYDGRKAEVKVKVEGQERKDGLSLRATVDGASKEMKLSSLTCDLDIPLGDFRPWSPEHPNLYTAKVELVAADGRVLQTRYERFGVRKLEVRGADFYLNGRPFFFRGCGYHNDNPIHGHSQLGDRAWRRFEVGKLKEAGFNACRLHTRCETPEFFDACDELGFLVQPELPYLSDVPALDRFEFNPVRDVKELYLHYRRHPSFAVYSHGNEGGFGPALDRRLYKMVKAMDPDRLVIEQDSDQWGYISVPRIAKTFNGPDVSDYVGGPAKEWPRGSAVTDRPMVCHEYLNLSVKTNPDLEDRYTGVWDVPYSRKQRAAWLAKSGLTHFWGRRLIRAQYALQAYWLKHGLEAARSDPYCDGYHYWAAQDTVIPAGESYAAIGLYDSFWDEKPGGTTRAAARQFNSPDCLLCDTLPAARIVTVGEPVTNAVLFAHYAEREPAKRLAWRLVVAEGRELRSGMEDVGRQAPGGVRKLAEIVFAAPAVEKPVRARFEVSLGSTANGWDLWIFPKRTPVRLPGVAFAPEFAQTLARRYVGLSPLGTASVVVAPVGSETAKTAAARGATVVSVGPAAGEPDVKLGWWWMGTQVGAAFADDPALAGVPHSGTIDGLFMRILKKGKPLPLEGFAEDELLAVGEGKDVCTYYLARRTLDGRREYLLHGLDVTADLPEAVALLDGILTDAMKK